MEVYKPKYFTLEELVHPQMIKAIGAINCWMRLDAECLKDLDKIRETWAGPIYLNFGAADSRGLRPPNDPDGSFYSVHKQGKAFDLVAGNGNDQGLFNHVKLLIQKGSLKKLNTLEDMSFTPNWVHVANMNHDQKPLIIKP